MIRVRGRIRAWLPGRETASDRALREHIVAGGGSLSPRRPGPAWRAWENRALLSDAEVDDAVAEVEGLGLVPHPDRPKNWDLMVALGSILEATTPRDRVLEMGAARYSPLLIWLYQYGYRRLRGIDLTYRKRVHRGPIRFDPMDLTATTFEAGSFDAIACLSVIEHGVDVEAYLREARRLLRPGGLLITSTDYWVEPVDAAGRIEYGHPVRIFDRPAIESFLDLAARLGFRTRRAVDLETRDRVVRWERLGLDYTFLVLAHVAPGRPDGPDPVPGRSTGLTGRLRRRGPGAPLGGG